MEQKLYTCDRCLRTTLVDRSYWEDISHSSIGRIPRSYSLLCPVCAELFKDFLQNRETGTTYIR